MFLMQENIGAFDIRLPEEAIKAIEKIHAAAKDPSYTPVED